MRYIWIIFAGLLVLMVAVLPRLGRPGPVPAATLATAPVAMASSRTAPALNSVDAARADSIAAFGLAQRGTPYVWAGTSPLTGFDCSGFILYTFGHFGVPVPHSTALLIAVGRPVARAEAQPGDIVVFTGTPPSSTTPGHAGIVVSRRGELPLRFVHASSSRREPFVKVNQVEDSDYERRFMQVRRVLGPGTGVAAMARAAAVDVRPSAAVVALPARPVPIEAAAVPVAKLPKVLPTRKLAGATVRRPATTTRPSAKKRTVARKPTSVKAKASTKASRKKTVIRKPALKKSIATKHTAPVRRK